MDTTALLVGEELYQKEETPNGPNMLKLKDLQNCQQGDCLRKNLLPEDELW